MILTPFNAFAGLSFGSVNPKFAAVNVYCVSSFVVTVLFVPAGSSFTAVTVRTNVSCACKLQSVTVTVIVVVPF